MVKKLLSQTAIYGLSNVLVKAFPTLIVFILLKIFTPQEYAVYSYYYAYASFINIILTHGMETTYFRFANKNENQKKIFSAAFLSIIIVSLLFIVVGYTYKYWILSPIEQVNSKGIAITWFIWILSLDAFSALPFAKLRLQEKAKKYLFIRVSNVLINFLCIVLFIIILPKVDLGFSFFEKPTIHAVFLANLIASILTFVLLIPDFRPISFHWDWKLWKEMQLYAIPVTVAGFAFAINENLDKILLEKRLPADIAAIQLGIYAGVYKIATFIHLFRQAYLLGVEPFFFSHSDNENATKTYAKLMKFFIILNAIALLFVVANLNWLGKLYIQNPQYWVGFPMVPIILIGVTFLGIYLNLSIWYKLSDKTHYGAYISIIGALLTWAINYYFIPLFGYWASTWATFIAYFTIMVISYYWGQKIYPIPYNKRKFYLYMGMSIGFSILGYYWIDNVIINNLLLLLLIFVIYKIEFPQLKEILKKK